MGGTRIQEAVIFMPGNACYGLHMHADMIRPGIALYGISPFAQKTAKELQLKPVMTLKAVFPAS